MNYLTEINAFNEWLETHPLDATTQALWYHLMAIANKCGWPEWFTVANATLQAKLGVDKKTVIRHRTILQKVARITYKNGSTRQAGKYLLHAFSGGISGKSPPIKGPITDQSGNQSRDHYINKTKTKLNKDKNIYADNVTMTKGEHQKLIQSLGEQKTADMIERLSLYKGSTGKKYASDYLTILNWLRMDKDRKKGGQTSGHPDGNSGDPERDKWDGYDLEKDCGFWTEDDT